jgi:hypothetical protein
MRAIVPNVPTPNARFPKAPKPETTPAEAAAPDAAELRPPKRPRSPNPLPMVPPPGHVGPPALPLGWVEAQDPRYDNATYYFHTRTKETSWTRPEEPLPTLPPPSRESREQLPPPLRATPRQPQTPEIEQQLDAWVTAKRNKDYEVADGLRALLKVRAKLVRWAGGRVGGRAGLWDAVGVGLGRGLGCGLGCGFKGRTWVVAGLGAVVNTPALKDGRRLTRPFPSRRVA